MEILIVAHGRLSEGMVSALDIIVGVDDKITFINAFTDEIPIKVKIDEYLESRENVLVFTDILSGSVNQAVLQHIYTKKLKIVTGMNLPLVLELVLMNKAGDISEDLIRSSIKSSQLQIAYVNDAIREKKEDDF